MLLAQARTLLVRRIISRTPLSATATLGNREFTSMSAQTTADELIATPVAVFSKSYCPYCDKVKKLLTKHKINYQALELDKISEGSEIQNYLKGKTGQSTVPSVWINGKFVGGCDDTHALAKNGKLKTMLDEASISYAAL